jgi:ribosomal protein L11 methyltransferase
MTQPGFILTSSAHAFGDGTHPTTAGVLAALEAIDPRAFTPRRACDIGGGSGILALAIARLFACPVIAADIAAESVATMRANAQANGLTGRVRAVQADGFFHPDIAAAAPFDLIVMNILAEPLMMLAVDAARALAAGGVLILSGMLQWQEAQIREAYQSLGLELTSRLTIGDWVTLVWQKQ